MGVHGAGFCVALAATLRAAVENRKMRFVPRGSVGGEAHEEGLGRFLLLPPVGGLSMGEISGVGVGVGLPSTGVDEGSLRGGVDEGLFSAGVEEGLLPPGVEDDLLSDIGVLSIRVLLLLPSSKILF